MALEFDEQLSRLEKPNRNEMTNKEYAVFNENVETMEKNWGFINNLFKVLPLNASQYIGFLDFKGSLFNPDTCYLTNADKEMIGVVVSSINCCSYCLTTHGDALRGYTKNPMLVDKLCYNFRSAKDLLTEKQYALCEYAWYVTKHADEIDETRSRTCARRASTTTRSWRPPLWPASSTTPTAGFLPSPQWPIPVTSATTAISRADPWRTKSSLNLAASAASPSGIGPSCPPWAQTWRTFGATPHPV